MKCINKKILLVLPLICCLFLTSCRFNEYNKKYKIVQTSNDLGIISLNSTKQKMYSDSLCKPLTSNTGLETAPDISHIQAAAVFDTTSHQTLLNYNMLDKVYPASTTKILTALTAFKYGNLDQKVIVSENAVNQVEGSSLAKVSAGDELTIRQLLYGLMLPSGNDAAVAIAEGIAGSEKKYVELMNKTAQSLGATHSHFVTTNGLHDDNHYTTCYDMYLILNAALQYDELVQIMSSKSYDAYFRDANGQPKSITWNTTDKFLNGEKKLADGFSVIAGKTGTTGNAKYCLALVTNAPNGHKIISFVYKADNRYNLYLLQNEILGIVK